MRIQIKHINRNEERIELYPCEVHRVIALDEKKFDYFKNHLMESFDFIEENKEQMGTHKENGTVVEDCIAVVNEGENEGIVINSEGFSYARYTCYMENLKTLLLPEKVSKFVDNLSNHAKEAEILADYMQNIIDTKEYLLSRFDSKKLSSKIPFADLAGKNLVDFYQNPDVAELLRNLIRINDDVSDVDFNFTDDIITMYTRSIDYIYTPKEIENDMKYEGKIYLTSYYNSFAEILENYDSRTRDTCVIEKIIELKEQDFKIFGTNLHQQTDFLLENQKIQYHDSKGTWHCIFLRQEDTNYGILLCHEAKEDKLYASFLPNLNNFKQQISTNQDFFGEDINRDLPNEDMEYSEDMELDFFDEDSDLYEDIGQGFFNEEDCSFFDKEEEQGLQM